jgi:hypothetical protein
VEAVNHAGYGIEGVVAPPPVANSARDKGLKRKFILFQRRKIHRRFSGGSTTFCRRFRGSFGWRGRRSRLLHGELCMQTSPSTYGYNFKHQHFTLYALLEKLFSLSNQRTHCSIMALKQAF